jgi:hypothetical protein
LETRPQFGSLQYFDGSTWKNLGIGATFTQQDIDDGKLRYSQNTQSGAATSGRLHLQAARLGAADLRL